MDARGQGGTVRDFPLSVQECPVCPVWLHGGLEQSAIRSVGQSKCRFARSTRINHRYARLLTTARSAYLRLSILDPGDRTGGAESHSSGRLNESDLSPPMDSSRMRNLIVKRPGAVQCRT